MKDDYFPFKFIKSCKGLSGHIIIIVYWPKVYSL